MKKILFAFLTAIAVAAPLSGIAGPDETQRRLYQRAAEAQQKLSAAESATGAQRQQMMQEHMKVMQEVMTQMQAARPGTNMTPQQMREWMDEHMKLMDQMMGQMMKEHHMMMMGAGK